MSPYERSRETAAGVAHGAAGIFEDRLRVEESLIEMDFGDFSVLHSDGMRQEKMPLIAEFYAKAREVGKFYARPPRGEDPMRRQQRVHNPIVVVS